MWKYLRIGICSEFVFHLDCFGSQLFVMVLGANRNGTRLGGSILVFG